MSDEFEATTQHIEALKRPVVFTHGVFDLFHAGHVHCLQEARKLGNCLVVGVNSDASARRGRKGPGRPFNNELHRCRVVAEMRCVDAVFLFEEELPLALLRKVRPDIYVKGNDYPLTALAEARVVAAWGGHAVIVPRHGGLSSSLLVNLILGAHATAPVTP